MLRTIRSEWHAMKTRTTVISSFAISRSRRWQWWAWLWHEFRMWREHDLPPPRWLVLETSSQALTRQHRRLTIWILGNMGWQDPYDITDTEARCLECLHSSHLMTNWGRACPHCAPEQAVCHLNITLLRFPFLNYVRGNFFADTEILWFICKQCWVFSETIFGVFTQHQLFLGNIKLFGQ